MSEETKQLTLIAARGVKRKIGYNKEDTDMVVTRKAMARSNLDSSI